MGGTRFMVQWEEHPSHLATRLGQLLEHQTLVDVTLMCNTHTLRVHRAVLAACSPYFETILQRQLGMHPLIVLKDMQFSVLKSLIEFMYCGETSVTEDNLGALLQAAKFFQVKGLSAMTKEALGLMPTPAKTPSVNGETTRKAFVGRTKKMPMQQTLVSATGLKTVTKLVDQNIDMKSSAPSQQQQQQQNDTAQLLLSLSGGEFSKQTQQFQNVRFQTASTEISSLDKKDGKMEGIEHTIITPNGGIKTGANATEITTGELVTIKDDGLRKRGRPMKKHVSLTFQEKVLTDADVALHKEAEASRKALEMLKQEMSGETGDIASVSGIMQSSGESVRRLPIKQTIPTTSKIQSVSPGLMNSRTLTRLQPSNQRRGIGTSNISKAMGMPSTLTTVAQKKTFPLLKNSALNSASSVAVSTSTHTNVSNVTNVTNVTNTNAANVVNLNNNASGNNVATSLPTTILTSPVSTVKEDAQQPKFYAMISADNVDKNEVIYQVSEEPTESDGAVANSGTNFEYQVADTSATGSVMMSQYMEVLKEAGLPTDVPILLDSGDGNYVTVNEEVLMNIVNGGVLQCHVADGNVVRTEGVEFIVQELNEGEAHVQEADVPEQSMEMLEQTSISGIELKENTTHEALVGETNDIVMEEVTNSADSIVGNNSVDKSNNEMKVDTDQFAESDVIEHSTNDGVMTELPSLVDEIMHPSQQIGASNSTVLSSDVIINEDNLPTDNVPGNVSTEVEMVTEDNFSKVIETVKEIESQSEQMSVVEESGNEHIVLSEDKLNNSDDSKIEMSVEQALEAMMGAGTENTTNTDIVASQRKSSEELCMVLTHEDEPKKAGSVLSTCPEDSALETEIERIESYESVNQESEQEMEHAHQELEIHQELEQDGEQIHGGDYGEENQTDVTDIHRETKEEDLLQEEHIHEVDLLHEELTHPAEDIPEQHNQEIENIQEDHKIQEIEHVLDGEEKIQEIENILEEGQNIQEAENVVEEEPKSEEIHKVLEEEHEVQELENTQDGETVQEVENFHEVEHIDVQHIQEEGSVPDESELEQPSLVEEITELEVNDSTSVECLSGEVVSSTVEEVEATRDPIISPSKDIPYAVGLLPLKAALEKLQSITEYHPRKTRSSSIGKEGIDSPANRLKRKGSFSDLPEKRFKEDPVEEVIETVDAHITDIHLDNSQAGNNDTMPSTLETLTESVDD